MISFSNAFSYAGTHVKNIEIAKKIALERDRGDFDKRMQIGQEAGDDILWWIENVSRLGRPLRRPKPDRVLFTDASSEGWGAHVGDLATRGRWSAEEIEDHINVLELRAILLGL